MKLIYKKLEKPEKFLYTDLNILKSLQVAFYKNFNSGLLVKYEEI